MLKCATCNDTRVLGHKDGTVVRCHGCQKQQGLLSPSKKQTMTVKDLPIGAHFILADGRSMVKVTDTEVAWGELSHSDGKISCNSIDHFDTNKGPLLDWTELERPQPEGLASWLQEDLCVHNIHLSSCCAACSAIKAMGSHSYMNCNNLYCSQCIAFTKESETQFISKCTCDIVLIMRVGCECGGK